MPGPMHMLTSLDITRVGDDGTLSEVTAPGSWTAGPEVVEGKDLKPEPLKDGYHDHGCDQLRYFFINHFPIKNREIKVRKR